MPDSKRFTKLERDVASLIKTVRSLTDAPRKQDVAPIRKKDHASNEGEATAVYRFVEGTPPYSQNTDHGTSQGESRWKRCWNLVRRLKWKSALEVIGIIAGIGYAIITFLQWRDLGRNFKDSQRAWVGPNFTVPVIDLGDAKTPAKYRFLLHN
jgi:hypothetical protein